MFQYAGDKPVRQAIAGIVSLLLIAWDGSSPKPGRTFAGPGMSDDAVVPMPAAPRSAHARFGTAGQIALSYEWLGAGVPGRAAIGQPLEVRVSVYSARPLGPLSAEVYAHEGLVVSPMNWTIGSLQARETSDRILTVVPYVAGSLRLSVLVQFVVDGQAQAAQITVPVGGELAERP